MAQLTGLLGCTGILATILTTGCHKKETRFVFVEAKTPPPVVVEPAPAEPPPPPAVVTPEPVVVAPAPVAVAPAPAPVVVAPAPAPVVVTPAPAVSVTYFHAHLGHHGRWVSVASYGQVWVPTGVTADWRPYTVGHWVYTDDYGWMWVSDEPWGWATYHYGRWAFTEPYGWVWVPGTVWGPAWVVWRTGGGYVGWAPMPPAIVVAEPRPSVEINVNINVNVVEHIHPRHWIFVSERHVLEPVHRHAVVVTNNITIIKNTRHATHIVERHGRIMNESIAVRDVERVTGHKVRPLRVRQVDADSPAPTEIKKDEVVIRRPQLLTASANVQTQAQPAAPKPTTTPRIPRARTDSPVKRIDSAAGAGTAPVTPSAPKVTGKEAPARERLARPIQTPQPITTPAQPTQTMQPTKKDAPPVGDHYTKPFPPPTQPKVDPGPGRKRITTPAEVTPQTPPAAEPIQRVVRKANQAQSPDTEPTRKIENSRNPTAIKRAAPTSRPSREDSTTRENVGTRRG